MDAKFIQEGASINYTPDANVSAGDVEVIGNIVGIAKLDISSGELGALAVKGVFEMTKAESSGVTFSQGDKVYWNASTGCTSTNSDTFIGIALDDAENADDSVDVILNALSAAEEFNQAANVASLTDSSGGTTAAESVTVEALDDQSGGTADTTDYQVTTAALDDNSLGTADESGYAMEDVTDTSATDQSGAIENNFATVIAAQNQTANDLATVAAAQNLAANDIASLTAKVNALLSAMETAGLMASS